MEYSRSTELSVLSELCLQFLQEYSETGSLVYLARLVRRTHTCIVRAETHVQEDLARERKNEFAIHLGDIRKVNPLTKFIPAV